MPEANFVIATIAVTINAVLAAQTLGSGSADETESALVKACASPQLKYYELLCWGQHC